MGKPRSLERSQLIGAPIPYAMWDVVIAEANGRGLTVAGLIRVALSEYTGLSLAKEKDVDRTKSRPETHEQGQLIA